MLPKKSLALALCLAVTGCAHTEKTPQDNAKGSSWWSFGGGKEQPAAKAAPLADPKVSQAWLDDYEPRLRAAIKGSNMELERRENALVVTAPVDSSFNPDRPAMLMPVTLGPFTRVAKMLEVDPKTSVLILGHGDTVGAAPANLKLSQDRAQSVAAIFRLSGLQRDRLILRGMGSEKPRADNESVKGRAQNRRVEIMLTQQETLVGLLSKYNIPAPSPMKRVAVQDLKPVTPVVAPTPAPAAKKTTAVAKKAAPVKKAAAKKQPAKKATPAKKAAPAKAETSAKKVVATAAAKN